MIEVSLQLIMSLMLLCATVFFIAFGLWAHIKDEMTDFAIGAWIVAGLFLLPQPFIWGYIVITV